MCLRMKYPTIVIGICLITSLFLSALGSPIGASLESDDLSEEEKVESDIYKSYRSYTRTPEEQVSRTEKSNWTEAEAIDIGNDVITDHLLETEDDLFWSFGDRDGSAHIYRSSEGGDNWSEVERSDDHDRVLTDHLLEDEEGNLFWSFGDRDDHAQIYRSVDGGENWEEMESIEAEDDVNTDHLLENEEGDIYWSFGDDDEYAYLYRSIDGGENWEEMGSVETEDSVNTDHLLEDKEGNIYWSFGDDDEYAYLYRSIDGGETWDRIEEIEAGDSVNTDHLLEDEEGDLYWSFGSDDDRAFLYRSVDGGENWTLAQEVETGGDVNTDHLLENEEGDLLWSFGCDVDWDWGVFLYRSVDGGEEWYEEEAIWVGDGVNTDHLMEDEEGDIYWSFGNDADNAFLYRSVDGGENWALIEHVATEDDILTDHLLSTESGDLYWSFGSRDGDGYAYLYHREFPAVPDEMEISPMETTIKAGEMLTYDVTVYDQIGNEMDIYPEEIIWEIDEDADGEWDENTYRSKNAGFWIVTGTLIHEEDDLTERAFLHVEAGEVDQVSILPEEKQTIQAGEELVFSAEAYDQYDNLITKDVAEFEWENAANGVFSETKVGEYEVAATYEGEVSEPITVAVEPADPSYIEIYPEEKKITAGESVTHTATAYDEFDNKIEEVTEEIDWSIDDGAGGDWDDNIYISEVSGEWTVEGEHEETGITSTVDLLVEHGEVDSVSIGIESYGSEEETTVEAGEELEFFAEARDDKDNLIVEDVALFEWEKATNGIFSETNAGEYEVTAAYEGVVSEPITVTVDPSGPSTLEMEPEEKTITAGESVNYTATTYDEFDNEIEEVTEETDWNIEGDAGGEWVENEYISEFPGTWKVTGTYENDGEDLSAEAILTVNPGEHTLTIGIEGEGTTEPEEGNHTYEHGTEVTIIAIPDDGWYFEEWTGDHESEEKEMDLIVDTDVSITARFDEFEENQRVLSISVDGNGTTEPAPGEHIYEMDSEVTVTAEADEGWNFSHWSGDIDGAQDQQEEEVITITMEENKSLTAHFEDEEVGVTWVNIVSPDEGAIFNESEVMISWKSENVDHHEIRLNEKDWINVSEESEFEFEDLDDDNHTVTVKAVGEPDVIDSVEFIVDTTPPEIEVISPEEGQILEDNSVKVEWNYSQAISEIDQFEIRIDGGEWEDTGVFQEYEFSDLSDGEHTIEIRARDNAGNLGEENITFEVSTEEESWLQIPGGSCLLPFLLALIIAVLMIVAWYRWVEDREEEEEELEAEEKDILEREKKEKEDVPPPEISDEKPTGDESTWAWIEEEEPEEVKELEEETKLYEEEEEIETEEELVDTEEEKKLSSEKEDESTSFERRKKEKKPVPPPERWDEETSSDEIERIGESPEKSEEKREEPEKVEEPEEPKIEEPKVEEPEEPEVEEPEEPKMEDPEEPKVEEPKVEEPKVEEPEEPKVEEPEEPKVEEPKVEEPKVEEPKVEEPKVEEPEEPKVEEPEEPKVEEPEEPEEPKVEEPEEPKVEEPKEPEDVPVPKDLKEPPVPEDIAREDALEELSQLKGVGITKAENLYENGIRSLEDLEEFSKEDLQDIKGIGPALSEKILQSLEEFKS